MLLADLARQFALLLRQEGALARAEMLHGLGQLGGGAALIAGGGLVAFAGLLGLAAAAILALSQYFAPWLAAVIVGGALLVIGIIVLIVGRARLRARSLVPSRTVRSLKDDAAWAREQMR